MMEYADFRDQVEQFAPDLVGNTIDESLEMAIYLSQNGLVPFRKKYGDSRFDKIVVNRWQDAAYVVHDRVSDLYFKSYDITAHATMQQQVMNELAHRLAIEDIGVQAVRHIAVINPTNETSHAIGLIESAPGKSVRARYPDRGQWMPIVSDVRSRLNQALGVGVRRILVNDIARLNNAGANIILGDDGVYRLIDQPFMANDRAYLRMQYALSALRRQNRQG